MTPIVTKKLLNIKVAMFYREQACVISSCYGRRDISYEMICDTDYAMKFI